MDIVFGMSVLRAITHLLTSMNVYELVVMVSCMFFRVVVFSSFVIKEGSVISV